MNISRWMFGICLCTASFSAFAGPSERVKADDALIDTACAKDAKIAGCSGSEVGTGLMRCLKSYRKSTKAFHLSDACREALEQRREDKKTGN